MKDKFIFISVCMVLLTACGATQPVATVTSIPTDTAAPTATLTSIPATATPVPPTAVPTSLTVGPFALSSPAFAEGQTIPTDFTCKGINISPALMWTEPPAGTQSFTIIMFDPTADFTHWVIYNIPASTRSLKEDMLKHPELSDGSLQANNGFGSHGYGGPCPSSKHTYVFTLYALDGMLSVSPTKTRPFVAVAMEDHILAEVELTGTFP